MKSQIRGVRLATVVRCVGIALVRLERQKNTQDDLSAEYEP